MCVILNYCEIYKEVIKMKKYSSPEIEYVRYDADDCLITSSDIPKETEDLGDILNDLL